MKICMIGLGSIGCRHVINIVKVCTERNIVIHIDALRSSKSELPIDIKNLIQTAYYNIDEIPADYDIVFITNPTNLHYVTLNNVRNKTKHIFIEKPIFESSNYKIDYFNNSSNIYYVACPLRYTAVIKYLKNIIDVEKIYSVRAISSSYLPDWRKDVDYRKVYSAKKELGGGVALDLIHEWDYLVYLFGLPEQVFSFKGKYSELEIDSDDLSVYIARYKNKLVELHLDYIGLNTIRKVELICNDYVIYCDLINSSIEYRGKRNEVINLPKEDFYLNEMNTFFDMILNKKDNYNDFEVALKTLQIALTNLKTNTGRME